MNTQTLKNPVMICNFIFLLPEEPICVSTRDYGFDFNEVELATELAAPLPISLEDRQPLDVDPDEFERLYQ